MALQCQFCYGKHSYDNSNINHLDQGHSILTSNWPIIGSVQMSRPAFKLNWCNIYKYNNIQYKNRIRSDLKYHYFNIKARETQYKIRKPSTA